MVKINLKKLKMKKGNNKDSCCSSRNGCGQCGAGYGLGVIGAAIYFIGQATTFWMGVLGLLKAFIWPVFLVHAVLKFVGA